jgi:hypothetical protein
LPVIPDNTEMPSHTREDPHDLVLEEIGILILIHHEVGEPVMEILGHIGQIDHLTEQEEEIIEIERIVSLESASIFLVDLEYHRAVV